MAFIPQPATNPFQENLAYLNGQGPIPIGAGAGGGAASEVPNQPSPSPASASVGTQRGAPGGAPIQGDQSRLISQITGPMQQKLRNFQGSLQGAIGQFNEGAGKSRTYGGIGGQGTLQGALDSGSDLDAAKGLAGARYAGPAGLDPVRAQKLEGNRNELLDFSKALQGGGGLDTLIRGAVPGLTQGSSQAEARLLGGNADFQKLARDFQRQLDAASRGLPTATARADAFAGQRTTEEDDIRTKSRDFLTGQKGAVADDINAQVAAANAREKSLIDQYNAYQVKGDINDLEGTGLDIGSFNSATEDTAKASQALYDEMVGNIPFKGPEGQLPITLGISGHGREKYGFNQDAGTKPPKGQRKFVKKSLVKLMQPLVDKFGPRTSRDKEAGELSRFNPLYFGDPLQLPEKRNYVTFEPGMAANFQNMASDEQKRVFNAAAEILGEAEKIGEAEPFRAAAVAGDAEKFLADVQANLDAQGESLDEDSKAWRKKVRSVRKKYRQASHNAKFAKPFFANAPGKSTGGSGIQIGIESGTGLL